MQIRLAGKIVYSWIGRPKSICNFLVAATIVGGWEHLCSFLSFGVRGGWGVTLTVLICIYSYFPFLLVLKIVK